jgi:hypothetical protein
MGLNRNVPKMGVSNVNKCCASSKSSPSKTKRKHSNTPEQTQQNYAMPDTPKLVELTCEVPKPK